MPSPDALVRLRRNRRLDQRRRRETRLRAGGVGLGLIISFIAGLLILVTALGYASLTSDLSNVGLLPVLLDPPDGLLLQPTRIYDRSNQHLLLTVAPGEGQRRYIPLSTQSPPHLPDSLANATIAASDPNFRSHGGFVLAGWNEPDQHPTLAQKLVSDLLLYSEPPSLRRAIRERILAAQLTQKYGRSQVLEWVLNSADYGNDAFGAEAAAQLYFGKSATDLTLAESAVLAATSQAPSLNPFDAGDAALQRGEKIIELMRDLKLITSDEASSAERQANLPQEIALQRALLAQRAGGGGTAPGFLHLVLSQLDQQFARQRIERGGVTVTTSLDYDLQQQALCTTLVYAARLAGSPDPAGSCPAANGLPPLPPKTTVADPSGSALIFDPTTGQVLAAVGETHNGVESALLSGHDPGTLMTPFVYLTAFTRGLSPASLVWDIPPTDRQVMPGALYHGPVRMRIALVNDYAVPVQTIATQMGAEAIGRTESSLGLTPETATLTQVAAAYGVFAADGVRYGQPGSSDLAAGVTMLPTAVLRVEGLDHSVWLDLGTPQAQPVVDPALAYLMNNVLSDQLARVPLLGEPNALEIDRPAAAKVGQTQDGASAWTVGYTPSRLVAVWTGTSSSASPGTASSGAESAQRVSPRIPTVLWNALIEAASQSQPPDSWTAPASVSTVNVCDPSGMLPSKDCPSVVSEVFLSGNEPVQVDTLYQSFAVNRETGFLATVFTPPELIENRVYMVVPPEAQAWAKSANIPVAPTAYDAIQAGPVNPDVRITSPDMFDEVKGQVQIKGTAAGTDFDRYRVLVGEGLDPEQWIQVGSDSSSPVKDGLLVMWDTTGLNGLYAVELQVIRSDQRVDSMVTQVTVNNK
jgi:membrane peptidoglycan carboxypeptidase